MFKTVWTTDTARNFIYTNSFQNKIQQKGEHREIKEGDYLQCK